MPYIKQEDRNLYDYQIEMINTQLHSEDWPPGAVNYVITSIIADWFREQRSYKTICNIMGTLKCVASEFYRRKAVPYEEEKIKENGDV